jgi:hypothetical protein
MNEERIKKQMEKIGNGVKPGVWFGLKMKYRLIKKSFYLYFIRPGAKLRFASAFIILMVMLTGGVGTYAYTSPEVNAANFLYPIKRGIESIEDRMITNPEDKIRLHIRFAAKRLAETEVLQRRMNMHMMSGEDTVRNNLENALTITMLNMQQEMNKSMDVDNIEMLAVPAEMFINELHSNFSLMNERMQRMQLHKGAEGMDESMQNHLLRLNRARQRIGELNDAQSRIQLKELLIMKGLNESEAEQIVQSRIRNAPIFEQ